MTKFIRDDGDYVLQLTWEDIATLLPAEVSKKVAEYAGDHITPFIVVQASTGKFTSGTPLFYNIKHDPNAIPPTIQFVSEETKAALKAKGLITWKDAEKMVNNRSLFHKLIQLGVLKYKEVDGVLFTVPESVITAINSLDATIKNDCTV